MPDLEPREAIEVWLMIDEDGVAIQVCGHGARLVDAYHAEAVSLGGAQAEVMARYTELGYKAEGAWRPQRWTTDRTGYGEIIHESPLRLHLLVSVSPTCCLKGRYARRVSLPVRRSAVYRAVRE